MTMVKEIEKRTEKTIEANPYTIRRLLRKWFWAMFFMLFVFVNPFIGMAVFFAMIIYSVYFLLKRKQFAEQEKQGYVEKS